MRYPFDKPLPKVTSPFGWRFHPIEKIRKHHNGNDYGSAVGTPVFAIANGTVVYAGASKLKFPNGEPAGGGYIVRIRFKDAGKFYTASYLHLRKGSIKVSKGERVLKGQLLAESGNTGESTGPHLHFEIQSGRFYTWNSTGRGDHDPGPFIKTRLDK
jgi:murein DD-endopeptidase MepM/ murein hydrolase activator NlpD